MSVHNKLLAFLIYGFIAALLLVVACGTSDENSAEYKQLTEQFKTKYEEMAIVTYADTTIIYHCVDVRFDGDFLFLKVVKELDDETLYVPIYNVKYFIRKDIDYNEVKD